MSELISHARFLEVRERRQRVRAELPRPPLDVPDDPTVSPDLPVTIICEVGVSKASDVSDPGPKSLVQ